jgi:hypothetical protein
VGKTFTFNVQHLGHTGDVSRSRSRSTRIQACDQHVHITTTLNGGGHGIEGSAFDGGVVVFSNY